MLARNALFAGLMVAGAAALWNVVRPEQVVAARRYAKSVPLTPQAASPACHPDVADVVGQLDCAFRHDWDAEQIQPARRADDLTIARRLSLALLGTVPSLEEIRRLEADHSPLRLSHWIDSLLADRRSADYLAERLARTYVGVENGPFLVFRRRRFVTWLAEQLAANRPYDSLVREIVSAEGLWTDSPATNFVTVTLTDGAQVPNTARLAGRVTRAFLGKRIDCAECHDHPFESWKQRDFAGLAAFFDESRQTFTGIRDLPVTRVEHAQPPDDSAAEIATAKPPVAPAVPWQPELLPRAGRNRVRLAAWLTASENAAFSRAMVNRMWGLMCGRPLEPVDNLPQQVPAALQLLAADFSAHGYDLRRLIRAIAAAEVYARSSQVAEQSLHTSRHAELWSVFPLTRLRPEQIARGIFQARSLQTVDQEASVLLRFAQFVGQQEFVDRNGDLGEDELAPQTGTIGQRLLLMNGKAVRETTDESNFVNASGRIAQLAPDDATAVEIAYLTILTRRPTVEETAHFTCSLAELQGKDRARRIEDLCWTLVNSMEFGWNH